MEILWVPFTDYSAVKLEMNDKDFENTTSQNPWATAKECSERKFIILSTYVIIRKEEEK